MNKKTLMEKGLSEKQADAVLDIWRASMKTLVPRERLNEVSGRLKEAKQAIYHLQKELSYYQDRSGNAKGGKRKRKERGGGIRCQAWIVIN